MASVTSSPPPATNHVSAPVAEPENAVTASIEALGVSEPQPMATEANKDSNDDSSVISGDDQTAGTEAPENKKRARSESCSSSDDPCGDPTWKPPPKVVATIGRESAPKGTAKKGPKAKEPRAKKNPPKKVQSKDPSDKSIPKSNPKSTKKTASKSTGSAADHPAKRTVAFKSRRGPSFQGTGAENALETKDVPLEFSTTCYYVQLGTEGQIFFIHEYHLSKSPRLYEEVKSSKAKLRKTQQQIIQLLPHDAGAFGQLVGFLYSDQFKPLECNRPRKMIGFRMVEIHQVMSLAKYYDMPGLQKEIMRVAVREKIVDKVPADAWFNWAEDMWYEEMEQKQGPFATYFRRHAPHKLLTAEEKDIKSMMKFISAGGEFVKEVFSAMFAALSMRDLPMVKTEPELNIVA